MDIFGHYIDSSISWTIIGIIVTILAWLFARKVRPTKKTERKIKETAQNTATTLENTKEILEILKMQHGEKIYTDGLVSAPKSVFDPFAIGTQMMAQSKWHDAIAEFKKSMTEAKGSQLVALYNLIGLCYYTPGKLDSAITAYNKSLELAREFGDKEGQGASLGNIGLIYKAKGDLDAALKYHQEALKIHREVGYKQGEASDLGNIGLIDSAKGDSDAALKYLEEARTILIEHNLARGRDIIENAIAKIKAKEAK